jgi:hypothetical protein
MIVIKGIKNLKCDECFRDVEEVIEVGRKDNRLCIPCLNKAMTKSWNHKVIEFNERNEKKSK